MNIISYMSNMIPSVLLLFWKVQTYPGAHIPLPGLPQRCVHQHHAPEPEETQILHRKYFLLHKGKARPRVVWFHIGGGAYNFWKNW